MKTTLGQMEKDTPYKVLESTKCKTFIKGDSIRRLENDDILLVTSFLSGWLIAEEAKDFANLPVEPDLERIQKKLKKIEEEKERLIKL